jgi:AraC-like DNA-binding protein
VNFLLDFLLDKATYFYVMALTLLLVFIVFAVRGLSGHKAFKWNLILLSCFLAYTFRVLLASEWRELAHVFNTLEYFIPVMFMLAVQANFDDDFRLGKVEWGVCSLICILLLVFLFGKPESVNIERPLLRLHLTLQYLVVGFCIFWAYWNVIRTWENDLVLLRRRARAFFVFLLGPAIFLGIVLYYVSLFEPAMVPYIDIFVSLGIILVGFLSLGIFGHLSFNEEPEQVAHIVSKEGELQAISSKTEQIKVGVGANVGIGVTEADEKALARLNEAMTLEKRFVESDLSIAKLASYVGMPEYRLRTLINRVLGYRNFNQYLNEYRIGAAKKALEDQNNKEPVLNISLDCGYLNQSTFHKAFKQNTGLTPAEYRESKGKSA